MVENYLFVELFHFHNKRNLTSLFGKYKWTFSMSSSEEEYTPCIETTNSSSACSLNERCIPFNIKKEENKMSTTTVKGNGKAAAEKAAAEKAAAEKAAAEKAAAEKAAAEKAAAEKAAAEKAAAEKAAAEKAAAEKAAAEKAAAEKAAGIIQEINYKDINSDLPPGNYCLAGFLNFTSNNYPVLGKSTQKFNRYLLENITLHNNGSVNNLLLNIDRQKNTDNSYRLHSELTEEIRAEFTGGIKKDPVEVWKKKMQNTYNNLLNSYNEAYRLKTIKGQDLEDMFKSVKRFYNIALRAGVPVDYPVQIKQK
jgi:chemotaxis protein histidine kinase CheA